ncbi:hypothetical protein RclHR1_17810006 [Rhizophagus clarus]|uniref:Uncharacterized protein n=1 Tax=Rhizophagus clarus TaxID=94130 RepID=A0A2Z6QQ06_9GLOM|nr:hypothetical protein RclHR1_17810006 [Rhizophagus clarus]
MNVDDPTSDIELKVLNTLHHPTPIISPAMPLSKAQKKAAMKKLKKLQQQQQTLDNNLFIIPNGTSLEQIPLSSKVVTFNNIPPQPMTFSKSSDNNKPLEKLTNNQEKKKNRII